MRIWKERSVRNSNLVKTDEKRLPTEIRLSDESPTDTDNTRIRIQNWILQPTAVVYQLGYGRLNLGLKRIPFLADLITANVREWNIDDIVMSDICG